MHRLAIIYLMSVLGISSYGQNDSLMIVDQKIIFIDSIENKKIIIDQSPIDLSEFKLHQNENKNVQNLPQLCCFSGYYHPYRFQQRWCRWSS